MQEQTFLLTPTQEDDDSEPPSAAQCPWFDADKLHTVDRPTQSIVSFVPTHDEWVNSSKDLVTSCNHTRSLGSDSVYETTVINEALKIGFSKVLLLVPPFQESSVYLQGRSQNAKSEKQQRYLTKLVCYIWRIFSFTVLFATFLLRPAMVFTIYSLVFALSLHVNSGLLPPRWRNNQTIAQVTPFPGVAAQAFIDHPVSSVACSAFDFAAFIGFLRL
jgi:hypothetical protein